MPAPAPAERLVEDVELDVGVFVDEEVADVVGVVMADAIVEADVVVSNDDAIVELAIVEVRVTSQYVGESEAVESMSDEFLTSPVKGLT
jgi:hypothetical protein